MGELHCPEMLYYDAARFCRAGPCAGPSAGPVETFYYLSIHYCNKCSVFQFQCILLNDLFVLFDDI